MSIVVPDIACLREPNLLIPGKKPIGPVKIDWDHPATRGLILSIVPLLPIGPFKILNLVDGYIAENTDSSRATSYSNQIVNGTVVLRKVYSQTTDGNYSFNVSINGLEGITILMVGRQFAAQTTYILEFGIGPSLCLLSTAGGTGYRLNISRGSYKNRDTRWPYPVPPTSTAEIGAHRFEVIDYLTHNYYYNSVLQTPIVNVSDSVDAPIYSGAYTKFGANATYKGGTDIAAIFVWDHNPSNELMQSIENDPYQFLIPA